MIKKLPLITSCFLLNFSANAADLSTIKPFIEVGIGSSNPANKLNAGIVSESSNYLTKKSIGNSGIYRTALGSSINENLRVSLEYLYGKSHKYSNTTYGEFTNVTNTFKVKHHTGLVNVYCNSAPIQGITPYVGLGVGVSQNKVSNTNYTDSDNAVLYRAGKKTKNSFAWGVTVGASYDINKSTYVDLSYKYLDLGTVKGGDVYGVSGDTAGIKSASGKLRSNTVMLSLGLKF